MKPGSNRFTRTILVFGLRFEHAKSQVKKQKSSLYSEIPTNSTVREVISTSTSFQFKQKSRFHWIVSNLERLCYKQVSQFRFFHSLASSFTKEGNVQILLMRKQEKPLTNCFFFISVVNGDNENEARYVTTNEQKVLLWKPTTKRLNRSTFVIPSSRDFSALFFNWLICFVSQVISRHKESSWEKSKNSNKADSLTL